MPTSLSKQPKVSQALSRESKRSVLVLRRLLAVAREVEIPARAKPEAAGSLIPVLLAGAWDETSESDREAMERLARKPYADLLTTVTRWVNDADPPVRRVGNIWQLVSRDDSWHLLARYIARHDLEALQDVTLDALGTIDPRYELPADDRWTAGIYGKRLPHSAFLRRGLAETLAFLATRGESAGTQGAVSAPAMVATIVHNLLCQATDWQLWASLSDLLPTMAEAAPEVFLDALEDSLAGEDPALLGIFTEEGPFGGSPHTGLLWALEVFAWDPVYLSRATSILARLAGLDPGGRLMNRPQNSLREIFLCWHPQTTATLEQRLNTLDTLLHREPDVGWKLLQSPPQRL